MQKSLKNPGEFFPGWSFNFSLFYLLCPSLKETEKKQLTTKIIKHNGRITFSISKETIIVLEDINQLKKKDFRELIKDFDLIYFYENNHIRKINLKKSKNKTKNKISFSKIIKIISLPALIDQINIFDSKYFDYFILKGLNQNYSPENTICLLPKNKYKPTTSQLIQYNFNSSKNVEDNDIPFYHPRAPESFSLFCSESEFRQIMKHIKTEEYKNQLMEKELKLKEEMKLKTEPEPNKKEFLCQICKARFDNYLEHIKSNLHNKNKIKYNDTFIGIKNTFKRIYEFNKDKKIKIIKNKNKNEFISFENNALVSTKEDSIPINEENNKNKEKKNLEKIVEKNEEEKSQKSEEKNIDISVNEILKLLKSIEIREKNGNLRKKRKKNEINIFGKDNNYLNEFKKTTGKIWCCTNYLDDFK